MKKLFLFILFQLAVLGLSAQNSSPGVVSGIITDTSGEPLAGVAVVVKGTQVNTLSSADGSFSIKAQPRDVLQFIMLGMKDQEAVVGNNLWLNIIMDTDVDILDEAVVTGYGTFKKSTYTGSASVVNTEKLRELPVVSLTQMMEGNLPGVQMFSSSGQPGSGTCPLVRGRGSINASTDPLFVLVGGPVGSGN